MPRYDRSLLRTVHLVPLTAFTARDEIHRELQGEHIARMYAAGMRVYMPAAGTSEFHSLSADEIVEVVRITREASGPDAQIFAPVGYQLAHALDVAERSLAAGATGIMFMPFAHPYLSSAGARDYYRAVIDRVGCPTLVYKKGPDPTDALLLELADDPCVVGVKYAVNEMHQFRRTVLTDVERAGRRERGTGGDDRDARGTAATLSGRIEWLCGSAERHAPFYMLAGATGYTTGAGNVAPHLTLAMHAALAAGEWLEGLRLQELLLPIEDYRAREGDSYNISMLKSAMTVLGRDFGRPRPPQRQVTEKEASEIAAITRRVLDAEESIAHEMAAAGLK